MNHNELFQYYKSNMAEVNFLFFFNKITSGYFAMNILNKNCNEFDGDLYRIYVSSSVADKISSTFYIKENMWYDREYYVVNSIPKAVKLCENIVILG